MFGLNNWNIGIINYDFWTKPKDKWLKTKYSPSATANNTTSNSLTIGATWPDNPTAYAPMYLENGVTYNVSYDLNSIYYMAGTDTVECRIHLPGGSVINQYTSTGTHSFSFMSNTTGWVDIEYAYLTDQNSIYTGWMPYIEIDNVSVYREIVNEDFSSSSIGAFVSLPGPASALSASSGTLRISTDEPFRAAAERIIPVTAGHKYSIDFDITHIYNLGVIPHDVRLRVEMAGYPTQHYTFPGLLSIPTVYVNVPTGFAGTDIRVEISSIMSSSAHTLGSFIEIDNFKVKHWEGVTSYTYDTICSTNGKRYRYGFNGQEKDNEIAGEGNSYTAMFWEYDSRLGRRWNVEPLIKKYPSLSSYVVFANSPIAVSDPDGREITITYKSNTDINGVVTSIDVHVEVTGKVLNNAHGNLDAQAIADFVNSEVTRLFNDKTIAFDNGIIWNITATSKITVANTMDDVQESDHLIAIVDDVEGSGFGLDYIGLATVGGKIAYAEKMTVGGGCSSPRPDIGKIGRIAVHELLHNFGLGDMYKLPKEEQISNNYMLSGALTENNQLTRDQMIEAIQGSHNQGSNSSKSTDVKDKNWYDTSNSDPSLDKTKGKDGRIPKILND